MRRLRFMLINPAILCFIALGLQAQSLWLRENNGTQNTHSLKNIEKIFFSSNDLIVKTEEGVLVKYDFNGIQFLNFTGLTTETNEPAFLINNSTMHLFPNPVNDLLKIRFLKFNHTQCTIEILSLEGKLMFIQRTESNELNVDVSRLPDGIYLCKLKSKDVMDVVKFIKQ